MEIFQANTLILFMLFFIPGFISIKVYDLLMAGPRRDFSRSLLDVVAYSSLNYAAFLLPIILINRTGFVAAHPWVYFSTMYLVIFIAPLLWPIILLSLSKVKWIEHSIINPVAKPWDAVFSREFRNGFILAHLNNGKRIGGYFDEHSWASTYPEQDQVYIERLWQLSEDGAFLMEIEQSKGALINGSEISYLEFFRAE